MVWRRPPQPRDLAPGSLCGSGFRPQKRARPQTVRPRPAAAASGVRRSPGRKPARNPCSGRPSAALLRSPTTCNVRVSSIAVWSRSRGDQVPPRQPLPAGDTLKDIRVTPPPQCRRNAQPQGSFEGEETEPPKGGTLVVQQISRPLRHLFFATWLRGHWSRWWCFW